MFPSHLGVALLQPLQATPKSLPRTTILLLNATALNLRIVFLLPQDLELVRKARGVLLLFQRLAHYFASAYLPFGSSIVPWTRLVDSSPLFSLSLRSFFANPVVTFADELGCWNLLGELVVTKLAFVGMSVV
jgi:hypothetical protein